MKSINTPSHIYLWGCCQVLSIGAQILWYQSIIPRIYPEVIAKYFPLGLRYNEINQSILPSVSTSEVVAIFFPLGLRLLVLLNSTITFIKCFINQSSLLSTSEIVARYFPLRSGTSSASQQFTWYKVKSFNHPALLILHSFCTLKSINPSSHIYLWGCCQVLSVWAQVHVQNTLQVMDGENIMPGLKFFLWIKQIRLTKNIKIMTKSRGFSINLWD